MSAFLDSNILIYADDVDAGDRNGIARALVRRSMIERSGVVSTQVLQEYYVNARRKLGLDGATVKARVERYTTLSVVTVTTDIVLSAIDLHRLDTIAFWDALIVCAADQAGCDVLYSEDLQNGRRFGGVRVVNPFV